MQVVATAGHVDHGKSTLVRALTGMEPDRWAEERRRGMTIDLGYAWTTLPSGREVAFVDVPGHARFVRNMLAGVGPVPAVMFVVAADEGWQPQSSEHLAAIDAYGVRHGLLVVARADLADPSIARAEALERLAATSLGPVDSVACSAVTGKGLDDVRAALDRLCRQLPQPDPEAAVRLWVDRAFSIHGSGTVVTGTLGAGTLRTGDELTVLPGDRTVRVRALESLKRRADEVPAVARVAVNLRGIDAATVRRGMALCTPGVWPEVATFDAVCDRPEQLPTRLVFHLGSAAVPARLRPFGPETTRVSLEHALPIRPGDRALLRDPSRHDRIVGVKVLDVAPPKLARRGSAAIRATELASMSGHADPLAEIARRGAVRRADLVSFGSLSADESAPSSVVVAGEWLVAPDRWAHWCAAARAAVAEEERLAPLGAGLALPALARRIGLPDARMAEQLARAAGLAVVSGRAAVPGRGPVFPPAARRALDALRAHLAEEPFAAAEVAELGAAGLDSAVLAAAVRIGELTRVAEGVYLLPTAYDDAFRRLATLPQPFTVSQARQVLGTSRRVAVPLLEALDAAGRTRRVDNAHREVIARSASPGTHSAEKSGGGSGEATA